ncbi:hypothetical protein BO70DRAFT_222261 [Aspergillus heteromorphus CBS 117.55]|uniref:Uncharacterized protein n=1 Tax=Aspergillus heteromorphus CBS 117.55 TaxID=1448321 RepID=A0A317WJD4_9EURO|nr:uncharacterized protein BO70DRAFT_222261 [Aspergillus heteromorphus CBS 117.55]PWY86165.1 hypothetical protein BO70DRAFT_222261 [Aspergillus heteromorphus CBS 117.55]
MAFFFICPRFRRYWRSSDSPDPDHAYQLRAANPPPDGDPEGHSSSRDDAFRPGHHRGSSGLSDKLRKRFSREAKDPRGRPRRTQKKSGASGFLFSSRPANGKGVVTPDGLGSSLMSERGYDSDAQFISTPQPASYAREHLGNSRFAQEATSPLRQPLWEMEQESPYEQGDDALMDYTVKGGSPTAMRSPNQTSWATLSSHSSSVCHGAEDGWHRARVTRPPRGPGGSPVQSRVRNGPMYPQQQGYRPLRRPTPDSCTPGRFSQNSTTHCPVLVSPAHSPEHATHLSPVPFSYTTSAESMTGPVSQISIKKRRRQQPPVGPASDGCSVHLADMNIPTVLGSHSPSPQVLSPKPSLDENRWAPNAGTWGASQNFYDSSGSPTGRAHLNATGPRFRGPPMNQASSCYSQKTGFSSASGPNHSVDSRFQSQFTSQPFAREPSPSFSYSSQAQEPPLANYHRPGVADSHGSGKPEMQKSNFTERFESDRSLASHGQQGGTGMSPASPRNVSVGWMSGGRRLGYGYTMVPANDGADHPSQGIQDSLQTDSCQAAPAEKGRPEMPMNADKEAKGHNRKASDKTGEPGLDISSIMNRMHLRSLSSALSEVTSGDFRKGSLLEKISKRKKDQSDTNADTKNPWDFCSWVDPNRSLSEQQSPQKSPSVSTKSTQGRTLSRWETLRRTGSLWTKGHSVSAIARGIEAKAHAKSAAPGGRYPVARRKDRQVMKFRVLDRNHRAHSADDAVPFVPVEHSDESPSSPRSQDEEQVDEEQITHADNHATEKDQPNPSDNSGQGVNADEWEDCQEMASITN